VFDGCGLAGEEYSSQNTYQVGNLSKGGRNGTMIYAQDVGTLRTPLTSGLVRARIPISLHDKSALSGTTLMMQCNLDSQALIGWRMFVEVWMSKQWALAQQHYYSLTKFR
jgi:hypothetical protein